MNTKNPLKIIALQASILLSLSVTPTYAQFGLPKVPGITPDKPAAAAKPLTMPELPFTVEGAPSDVVDSVFFYGDATKSVLKMANAKCVEAIGLAAKALDIEVSVKTAEEQAKALQAIAEKAAALTELDAEKKAALGQAWRQFGVSQLLAVQSGIAAKTLVDTAQGIPDAVKGNPLKLAVVGKVPEFIKTLSAVGGDSINLAKNNGTAIASFNKIGDAVGVLPPSEAEVKTSATQSIKTEMKAE
jgi:hypothetical protein